MQNSKFPISNKSLHISEIVIDCKIISKTMTFGHFGHVIIDKISFGKLK